MDGCQETLEEATEPWGVKVERVEVKDVRVPEQLMRAMAAEAEAAREARAKVIAAEGEHKASRALKHAAEVIGESPAALQVGHQTVVGFTPHTVVSCGTCRPWPPSPPSTTPRWCSPSQWTWWRPSSSPGSQLRCLTQNMHSNINMHYNIEY